MIQKSIIICIQILFIIVLSWLLGCSFAQHEMAQVETVNLEDILEVNPEAIPPMQEEMAQAPPPDNALLFFIGGALIILSIVGIYLWTKNKRHPVPRKFAEPLKEAPQESRIDISPPGGVAWRPSVDIDRGYIVPSQGFFSKEHIVGKVRGKQDREEEELKVWSFRIERIDKSGNPLSPIQVEMRGKRFEGSINDGDEVELKGKLKGGIIYAKKVYNRTTSVEVKAKKGMLW